MYSRHRHHSDEEEEEEDMKKVRRKTHKHSKRPRRCVVRVVSCSQGQLREGEGHVVYHAP